MVLHQPHAEQCRLGQIASKVTRQSHDSFVFFSPQLIFADRSNKRLYVTTDEGDNYTHVDILFQPDRLVFQSSSSPNVTDGDIPLYLYVLGYDASNKTVS